MRAPASPLLCPDDVAETLHNAHGVCLWSSSVCSLSLEGWMGMSMWEDSPPVSAPFYLEWSALLSQTSPWRASPSPRVAWGWAVSLQTLPWFALLLHTVVQNNCITSFLPACVFPVLRRGFAKATLCAPERCATDTPWLSVRLPISSCHCHQHCMENGVSVQRVRVDVSFSGKSWA